MARPEKIRWDHIDLMDEYVKSCKDEYKKILDTKNIELDVNIPTYADLILFWADRNPDLQIDPSTIDDWNKKGKMKDADEKYVKFSKSLKRLLLLQQSMLQKGGLSNRYNPIMAKMMLNVNHGMKETNVQETKHSGEIKVDDAQKAKIASRILKKDK